MRTSQNGDLVIYNDSGNAVSYANTDITSSSELNPLFAGDVLEVAHYNHGMTAGNNTVQISGVQPTTKPVVVTSAIGLQDSVIVVGAANTSEFATFEGITTSTGYVKVNNEIIYYNSITNVGLGISERGIDGSNIVTHPINSLARKYEFNGLSLTGINTTHTMPSDATLTSKKILIITILRLLEVQEDQIFLTEDLVIAKRVLLMREWVWI